MNKKSPLKATFEELCEAAREAFSEQDSNSDLEQPVVLSAEAIHRIQSQTSKEARKTTDDGMAGLSDGSEHAKPADNVSQGVGTSWDEFFDTLEATDDFLLDREQGQFPLSDDK